MLAYTRNEFTERKDLGQLFSNMCVAHNCDYVAALAAAGYFQAAEYCSAKNIDGLGMEVYVCQDSETSPLTAEYDYLIAWSVGGIGTDVLVKDAADLFDFLGKYLPVIKLGGELTLDREALKHSH